MFRRKKLCEKINKKTVIEHLKSRPMKSVVRTSMELESDVALKVMCVLDYYLDHRSLYSRIQNEPKLLEQLIRFNSFASFRYFKYCNKQKYRLNGTLLQCEHCELIGTSVDVLEHMVLNHGHHKSTEHCFWCGDSKSKIQSHIESNTLEKCYQNYLENLNLHLDHKCPTVIGDFYKLIRQIANELGVLSKRRYYNATFLEKTETISIDDDDDDLCETIQVEKPRFRTPKSIHLNKLDNMFRKAMKYFDVLHYLESPNMVPEATRGPPVLESHKDHQNQPVSEISPLTPQMSQTEPQISPMMSTGGPAPRTSPMFQAPPMIPMPPTPPEMSRTIKIFNHISTEIISMNSETNRRETLDQIRKILLVMKAKDLDELFKKQ